MLMLRLVSKYLPDCQICKEENELHNATHDPLQICHHILGVCQGGGQILAVFVDLDDGIAELLQGELYKEQALSTSVHNPWLSFDECSESECTDLPKGIILGSPRGAECLGAM